MGSKNIIKVLILLMMLMLVLMFWEQELSTSVNADGSAPTLSDATIKWELGSGIYLNNHKYVALGSNASEAKFLLDETYSTPTSEWNSAATTAKNYISSGNVTAQERQIVMSSELVNKSSLHAAAGGSDTGIIDARYYAKVNGAWWTADTAKFGEFEAGGIAGGNGELSTRVPIRYEKLEGKECVTREFNEAGYSMASGSPKVDFGSYKGEVTLPALQCRYSKVINNTDGKIGSLITSKDGTCSGSVDSSLSVPVSKDLVAIKVEGVCPSGKERIKSGTCLRGWSGDWLITKDIEVSWGAGTETYTWSSMKKKVEVVCRGIFDKVALGIRPAITLNPQSYIIASIPISETPDKSVSSTLTDYTQPTNEMVAGADYKFQLFDSTQKVTSVSKPATKQDNLFAVTGNTVQVELGTTEVTLDASVTGTHNYISAMATDKKGSTTLYGKIGSGSAANNSITLDISKIMDTSKTGKKQVNLYSEQITGNTYSDYVSSTPLTITFEVLPAKSDQVLTLDESYATEMMYGDTITLKAYVNAEKPELKWATATGTDIQFALVGNDAARHVKITNSSYDSAKGIAEVTIEAISGEEADIKLSVNKKGDHLQRYNDAVEIKTKSIKIKQRPITVTPKKTIMKVGDTYPPAWQFDAKMTDPNNKTAALVAGDTLPYTVETLGLDSGTPEGPTLDGNIIKDENSKKKWRLSVVDKTAAEVEAFEKNYLVTRNHYDVIKNKKSTLEISNIPYEGMEFIEHPDDVVTLVDETFTFNAKATYPTNDVNGSPITDVENTIQYTWQQRADVNAPWEDVKDGTQNVTYENGEAIFTYTRTAGASESTMQYRCIATNARDRADGVTAFSKEAGLTVRTEPLAFIQVPQEVELVEKDGKIAENKLNKEKEAIKLYDYVNEVSENTETIPQIPTGTFEISTDEFFYLTANGDSEKQYDKKFKVTVYRSNGIQLTKENTVLTILDYTTKKQDTFILRTPIDRMKKEGTYKGIMTFIVRYVKASAGGS